MARHRRRPGPRRCPAWLSPKLTRAAPRTTGRVTNRAAGRRRHEVLLHAGRRRSALRQPASSLTPEPSSVARLLTFPLRRQLACLLGLDCRSPCGRQLAESDRARADRADTRASSASGTRPVPLSWTLCRRNTRLSSAESSRSVSARSIEPAGRALEPVEHARLVALGLQAARGTTCRCWRAPCSRDRQGSASQGRRPARTRGPA